MIKTMLVLIVIIAVPLLCIWTRKILITKNQRQETIQARKLAMGDHMKKHNFTQYIPSKFKSVDPEDAEVKHPNELDNY